MSLMRKGLLVSGAQVLGIPIGMLSGVLFARVLGPDGVGQYEVFRTTAIIGSTFATLGLGQASIYFLNHRGMGPDRIATHLFEVGVFVGGFAIVALWFVLSSFPGYFGPVSLLTAVVLGVGTAAIILQNLLRPVLVAQLAARRIALADLSRNVLLVLGGLVLALAHLLSTEAAVSAFTASNLAALALILVFVRSHVRLRAPFEWGLMRDLFGYGLKMAALNLVSVVLAYLPVLLLRYLRPEDFQAVGLYTRASAVCVMISVVPTAVGPLLYARWSSVRGAERARQAELAARLTLAYGITSCIGLLLLGKYIIWLLYGAAFVPAAATLIFLGPAIALAPLFEVCNNLLAGDGRAALMTGILTLAVLCLTGVALAAVPRLGIQGAALAVLAGNFVTVAIGLLVCRQLYGIRVMRSLLLRREDLRQVRAAVQARGAVQTASE